MKYLIPILSLLLLSSCVSKRKYNELISDIESKEKQRKKLELQIEDLKIANQKLRDSAELLLNE